MRFRPHKVCKFFIRISSRVDLAMSPIRMNVETSETLKARLFSLAGYLSFDLKRYKAWVKHEDSCVFRGTGALRRTPCNLYSECQLAYFYGFRDILVLTNGLICIIFRIRYSCPSCYYLQQKEDFCESFEKWLFWRITPA